MRLRSEPNSIKPVAIKKSKNCLIRQSMWYNFGIMVDFDLARLDLASTVEARFESHVGVLTPEERADIFLCVSIWISQKNLSLRDIQALFTRAYNEKTIDTRSLYNVTNSAILFASKYLEKLIMLINSSSHRS